MAGRRFYPSVFNPTVAPDQAPAPEPQGWGTVAPAANRRAPPRQQPPGETLPPGQFVAANTTLGGECFAPAAVRRPRPQQPQGEILPPGAFTTTVPGSNTTYGGATFAPDRTRRRAPQQPQGEVLPPGAFATTVPLAPNGGECFAPATTRRLVPHQPQGDVLVPGRVVAPSDVPGGPPISGLVHNLEISFDRAGERITQLVVVEADGEENRTVTVPAATADKRLRVAIDVSELKALFVHSDQDVTIETNSGTVPDDTLDLLANRPLAWYAGCGLANPFTADVTDLYLTNAGTKPATVRLLGLVDATPGG